MKKLVLFFYFLLISFYIFSFDGKNVQLIIRPVIGNDELRINDNYKIDTVDSIRIETLKFYLSGIELFKDENLAWKEENSFHLVDASIEKSLSITLKIPESISFNSVKFNIGIDSITNVSGAIGGDLDPTKGMYWTWQSGYINFKIEGKSPDCIARNNEFQFHLGGYTSPNNSLQTIKLNTGEKEVILLEMDIKKLLGSIDLKKQNQIMSPGPESVSISSRIPGIFRIP